MYSGDGGLKLHVENKHLWLLGRGGSGGRKQLLILHRCSEYGPCVCRTQGEWVMDTGRLIINLVNGVGWRGLTGVSLFHYFFQVA